jgi:ParB family chromosome partitioning protein
VLINLAPGGRVEIREGLAKPQIDPGTRAATAENPIAPKKPKAAYSAPLCRYIGWHKSLAVQQLLLANPRKAKEVAVIERLVNLDFHEAVKHLAKSEEPGSAYAALESQARLFAGWLGFDISADESVWAKFPPQSADALRLYEAVQGLGDQELEQLHTLLTALSFGQVICERLDARDSLFNRVARDLSADMRNHWRPDRAFLERRSREQLIAVAKECGYADGVGSLGSYKKSELIGSLLRFFASAHAAAAPTPAQVKARGWLPEAMLFPAVNPSAQQEPEEDESGLDDSFDDEAMTEAA